MAASIDPQTEHAPDTSSRSHARLSALPAGQLWHGSASGGLKSAWKASPHDNAWSLWKKLLSDRKLPKSLLAGGKRRPHALLWGVDPSLDGWQAWRVELVAGGKNKKLTAAIQQWADRSDQRDAEPSFTLECLTLASELPAIAQSVDSETWWRLVEHLHEIALQTFEVNLGERPTANVAFAHQALGGELPLLLSRLLPEVQPLRQLKKLSSRLLTDGVLAMTDGEGLVAAGVMPRLPLLLACWTRCRTWAEMTGKPCWSADAETQYEWMVRQTMRLARPDATFPFTAGTLGAAALVDQALDLAGDVSDHAAAADRLGVKAYRQVAGKADPPEPSINSDWSSVSVLAADWSGKAQRAVVTYEGRASKLEYAAAGRVILSGDWSTEVMIDGKRIEAADEWEEQCWYSEDDCDYLELSLDLENGAELIRQMVVAREDRVVYLADIVRTGKPTPSKIEVTQRLPLGDDIAFSSKKETREGWLSLGKKQLAGVVPAALPEWRADTRVGELTAEDGCLVLKQSCNGRNLCCPLFLDSWPSRFGKQRTWRQLSVAQSLKKVAPDVAVGYRFQSGKDQWIAYRSLDTKANRTLLGYNLASEALFGRLLKSGEVDEFFEIEDE